MPSRYYNEIKLASNQTGVDPNLIRAVIKQESAFNPKAKSHAGAMGLMQLMPGTAQELGVKDPYNPQENIQGGATYLKKMLDMSKGNVDEALGRYNMGPRGFSEYLAGNRPIPSETNDYIPKVQGYYRSFQGETQMPEKKEKKVARNPMFGGPGMATAQVDSPTPVKGPLASMVGHRRERTAAPRVNLEQPLLASNAPSTTSFPTAQHENRRGPSGPAASPVAQYDPKFMAQITRGGRGPKGDTWQTEKGEFGSEVEAKMGISFKDKLSDLLAKGKGKENKLAGQRIAFNDEMKDMLMGSAMGGGKSGKISTEDLMSLLQMMDQNEEE